MVSLADRRDPVRAIVDLLTIDPCHEDAPASDLEWLEALADALGRLPHDAGRAASQAIAGYVSGMDDLGCPTVADYEARSADPFYIALADIDAMHRSVRGFAAAADYIPVISDDVAHVA